MIGGMGRDRMGWGIDNGRGKVHKVYHGVPAWSGTRRGTHRQRKEAVPLLVSFLDGW